VLYVALFVYQFLADLRYITASFGACWTESRHVRSERFGPMSEPCFRAVCNYSELYVEWVARPERFGAVHPAWRFALFQGNVLE